MPIYRLIRILVLFDTQRWDVYQVLSPDTRWPRWSFLFDSLSASVLAVAVVSLALVFGSRSVFVLVIGCERGRRKQANYNRKESN